MRLTCPNCAAQYEIDASLVPREGREVQCSNCDATWFATRTEAEDRPGRSEPLGAARPVTADPDGSERPRPSGAGDTPDDAEDAPLAPRRRELDERTRAILREEAAREAAQRRTPATPLPANDADLEPRPAPRAPVAPPPAASAASEPIRARLPEPEPIGSTLAARPRPDGTPRADRDAATAPAETDGGEAGGFWPGFVAVMALAAILAIAYVMAPRLVDAVPAIEPQVASYVAGVNDMRAALDRLIADLAGLVAG